MNYFDTLPNELIYYINEKLDYKALKALRTTNYQLYSLLDGITYQRLLSEKLEKLIDDIVDKLKIDFYHYNGPYADEDEDDNDWGIGFSYEQYIKADNKRIYDFKDLDLFDTQVILHYKHSIFTCQFVREVADIPQKISESNVRKFLRTIITNNYVLYMIDGTSVY